MAEAGAPERRYVIDTNVLAYYALRTAPYCKEVSGLFLQPFELIAPESWQVELLNAISKAIRYRSIDLYDGLELLEDIESLLNWSVPVRSLWREALVFAEEHNCSTYDTLFVVLAERENSDLLTYDQRMLTAFPEIAKTPGQVMFR
ncbi:MAG: type II toxin-antitoxin system VapC family toxin [Spirochaetaceae bacterium]|nr:MAG: type II toxin-antitoxin system VapC family toxin [Spirochaetaceae bacterium]